MRYLLIISMFFVLAGCGREDSICLKRLGERQTRTTDLEAFHSLVIDSEVSVEIVPSTENKVVVTTGENVLPSVTHIVTNEILTLDAQNGCRWYRRYGDDIRVEVHTTGLRHILMNGSAKVTNRDTLRGGYLLAESRDNSGEFVLVVDVDTMDAAVHTGPTDVFVFGYANQALMYTGGNGTLDFRGLQANDVHVNHGGTNHFYAWCTGALNVLLNGTGSLYYKGSPTLSVTNNGPGEVAPIP